MTDTRANLTQATAPDGLADNPPQGLRLLSAEIAADPEMAWGVFCNIAVPIMDATGVGHKLANETGAHLMQHLFGHDITTHQHYEHGKSGAQSYAEFRIAMDKAEDIAALSAKPTTGDKP